MNALLSALAILCALSTAASAALFFLSRKSPGNNIDLVEHIDALLPQTQCGECGHPGCRPYAQAIANGEAINRCPPGGARTIAALADFLNVPIVPLDGVSKPATVAYIREAECIGCTKCIQACPVDAIVGAAKLMHTVIADECTGCDLCVEPCPVDCIEMRPLLANDNPLSQRDRAETRAYYRQRFIAHNARIAREHEEQALRRAERRQKTQEKINAAHAVETLVAPVAPANNKQDEIREAIARAKARKAAIQPHKERD
jgi:electron transport complex protein RnfB